MSGSTTSIGKAKRVGNFDLPAELWRQIFDFAIDEDVLFQYFLPNAMAESAWFKTAHGDWALRTPQEALNLIQRRNYTTKKAIIATCKEWYHLGLEFLYRCLFFDDISKLRLLCAILDNNSSLGWWTRRIHVTQYYTSRDVTMDHIENPLISVIRHCSNLEIFIFDYPAGNAFGPMADALSTYCSKSLRTVHWNAPSEALAKVIWALASLPLIVSAHVEFGTPEPEILHLGSAYDVHITLPKLQQLSLSGSFQEFLEQATGWRLPSLRSFSFNSGFSQMNQPDAVAFLTHHGASLIFLDLFSVPPIDVAKVLELCPLLKTFTFNTDWLLPSLENDTLETTTVFVNHPHDNITHIGCHGLLYAFGVSHTDPLHSLMIRRRNDRNFSALNRLNFPVLKCVRVLSRTVLSNLNVSNGPEHSYYERWDRWWSQCTGQGIRLEDCTGNELGFLPQDIEDEQDDEESDDEDNGEFDGEDKGEFDEGSFEIEEDEDGMGFKFVLPRTVEEDPVSELKLLLEECRIMTAGRDEKLLVPPPDWQ